MVCQAQTWLELPVATGYVDLGDLDVAGTEITVEALYTSTNPASVDLVSKHSGFADVNYLLRQTHAELSTSNGFSTTPSVCPPDQNTCRHAAMVYDGTNLRFYLNGQLNGQVPFSGTLAQNNFSALVGNYGCCYAGEQFFGFIDEVRIWNVARTQTEIQTNMMGPLPSPTTQFGLMAYYSFSSTINLQGNAAFDGFLAGTGTIGRPNPFCASLSPVCAILDAHFEQFTMNEAVDGLQFEWKWQGQEPVRYHLLSGNTPDNLHEIQALPGHQNDHFTPGLPLIDTWFRLEMEDADGQRIASNQVLFSTQANHNLLQLKLVQGGVQVLTSRPMAVRWQFLDLAGRLLAGGEAEIQGSHFVALPKTASQTLLMSAQGQGCSAKLPILRQD